MDPVGTTILSTINASLKIAEYGLRIADAGADKRLFCRLIERVHKDYEQADRQRREMAEQLEFMPTKKAYIVDAIQDAERALFEIGKTVEPARNESSSGKRGVSLKERIEWVLVKKDVLLTKQSLLFACQHSLSNALGILNSLPLTTDQVQRLQALEESPLKQRQWDGPSVSEHIDILPSGPPPSYTYPGMATTEKSAALRGPWARRPMPKSRRAISEPVVMQADTNFMESLSGEFDRILSDSPSVSSSRVGRTEWENISEAAGLETAVESPRDYQDNECMSKPNVKQLRETKSLDPLEAPRIVNDRRRRNEARFGQRTS